MNNALSKADQSKINKWEDAFEQLISGEKKYFSISKLISIKSLCKEESVRQRYCWYLFYLVANRVLTDSPKQADNSGLWLMTSAIKEATQFSVDELTLTESIDKLRALHHQLADYQSETKNVKSTTVRLIKNNDLHTLELLLKCLLNTAEIAQKIAYEATRNHVEKYNPSCGTGLITDSIPALEEVLVFWRGESGEYEF